MTQLAGEKQESTSPFHPGEQAVQTGAGVREEAETRGRRMLTPDINAQQMQFFRQLPFIISAHTDAAGQPWASLLTGDPGFISIEEHRGHATVHVQGSGNPTAADPRPGADIGLLGIDLATRRRNRLNGTMFAADKDQWRLVIDQAYGNCPKYINERQWPGELLGNNYTLNETGGLSSIARQLATRTDTFFIATSSGPQTGSPASMASAWGADVSHRGGQSGFLQCRPEQEPDQLLFEDYPGNNMFNTLGNITQHPPCGILIIDFDSGDIVQLAASGRLEHSDGTRRVVLNVVTTRHWHART